MPYSPPSGWIENRPQDNEDDALHIRFHTQPDCSRIADPGNLRKVDKPYSATRCMLCASELDEHIPAPRTASLEPSAYDVAAT
jgi:hypothetical protein